MSTKTAPAADAATEDAPRISWLRWLCVELYRTFEPKRPLEIVWAGLFAVIMLLVRFGMDLPASVSPTVNWMVITVESTLLAMFGTLFVAYLAYYRVRACRRPRPPA
jgi:hypothetical protein